MTKKAQTIITITEEQSEEKNEALKELLNSPKLLEKSTNDLRLMIAEIFATDIESVEVEIKAEVGKNEGE